MMMMMAQILRNIIMGKLLTVIYMLLECRSTGRGRMKTSKKEEVNYFKDEDEERKKMHD